MSWRIQLLVVRVAECPVSPQLWLLTARRFNELPTAARAGMSFCTIPVNGWELWVQIKSPGRWLKVRSLDKVVEMEESRLTAENLGSR